MPYHDSLPDTLIVDGQDLQLIVGVTTLDLTGLLAPVVRRGSFDVIPGARGQRPSALPLDAYTFTIPVLIDNDVEDRAAMLASLRALYDAVKGTEGLVALTRRLSKVGGGYDTHTADGAFSGFGNYSAPAGSPNALTVDVQFTNTSGCWLDGSTVIVP